MRSEAGDFKMSESHVDVVRAWKDAEYRAGLSEAERAALPENPAGLMELSNDELEGIEGGWYIHVAWSLVCFGSGNK